MSTIYIDEHGVKVLVAHWYASSLLSGQDIQVDYTVVDGSRSVVATPKNIPHVILGLPEIIETDRPIIVTDCDLTVSALASALKGTAYEASIATCWPLLLNGWPMEMTKFMKGKHVLLLCQRTLRSRKRLESAGLALRGVAAQLLWAEIKNAEQDIDDYCEQHQPELLQLIDSATDWKPNVQLPRTKTVAELKREARAKHRWTVDRLLLAGGVGLLVGVPKDGKSTLAREAVADVTVGHEFLGRSVERGSAAYFVMPGEGVDDCVQHLHVLGCHDVAVHQERLNIDELTEFITRDGISLVVIDTVYKFMEIKSFHYGAVIKALSPLSRVAHETGAHILGIHHLNGNEKVLGRTGVESSVDVILYFRRVGDRAVLTARGRDIDWTSETLDYDPETRRHRIGRPELEVRREEMAREFVEFVRRNPGTLKQEALAAFEGKKQEKLKAWNLAEKELIADGRGVRSHPLRYFVSSRTTVINAEVIGPKELTSNAAQTISSSPQPGTTIAGLLPAAAEEHQPVADDLENACHDDGGKSKANSGSRG